jgi:6-phospho-beta-glucosidase
VKLALLGGGGFRAPLVYRAVARGAPALPVEEFVLHDVDPGRLARIQAVIRGMAPEPGDGPPVRTTTSLHDAVDGADFVFCAVRVGGLEGRVVDETVPLSVGVLGQETVGPGGICFALRTVPVVAAMAAEVARLAPTAWFVNFTNPAGLVTEAIRDVLGDRAIGICDSPTTLCEGVARAVGRPAGDLWFDYVGLNHLGWLRAARASEGDLLPDLLRDERALRSLPEQSLFGTERLRKLGMIPNEYLVYYEHADRITSRLRGKRTRAEFLLAQQSAFYAATDETAEDALASWRRAKDQRNRTYMDEALSVRRDRSPAPILEGSGEAVAESDDEGYGRIAAALASALSSHGRDVLILEVANRGSVPFLDDDAVVEVPCVVGRPGPAPLTVGAIPGEQRRMIERMKEVERATIRAARDRSPALAVEAMAMHPLVGSRALARQVFDRYVAHHAWLREWAAAPATA